MLAPNHVSAPAATQTSSMPPRLGTARLTSDGWTKIDAPTIVPTTIAVAWGSPIDRVNAGMSPDRYVISIRQERSDRCQRVGLRGRFVRAIPLHARKPQRDAADRKSTRLNSSHLVISY